LALGAAVPVDMAAMAVLVQTQALGLVVLEAEAEAAEQAFTLLGQTSLPAAAAVEELVFTDKAQAAAAGQRLEERQV
jgi:hypothetical protein